MLKSLSPNIMVEDVNKTVEYYKEVFGFQLTASVPPQGIMDWAMLTLDNVTLMFQARKSLSDELPFFKHMNISASMTLYIKTGDVKEFYEKIKGKARIIKEPYLTFYGATEIVIKDINGYILVFASDNK